MWSISRKLKKLPQSTRKFRNKIRWLRQLRHAMQHSIETFGRERNFRARLGCCRTIYLFIFFFFSFFLLQMRLYMYIEDIRSRVYFHKIYVTHLMKLACRRTVNPPSMRKTCIKFCKQSISPEEASIIRPVNLDDG